MQRIAAEYVVVCHGLAKLTHAHPHTKLYESNSLKNSRISGKVDHGITVRNICSIVCDQERRQLQAAHMFEYKLAKLLAQCYIELRKRFIQQECLRFGQQCAHE